MFSVASRPFTRKGRRLQGVQSVKFNEKFHVVKFAVQLRMNLFSVASRPFTRKRRRLREVHGGFDEKFGRIFIL